MPDYDVLTIGAGHNALVASAYLAQAGLKVGVFERREIAGGAVSTVEHVPGYKFDLGGSAHILIRNTPILVQMLIIYFIIAAILGIPREWAGILCLAFYEGAFVAEIVRGGINAVRKGQREAGLSLGLSNLDLYRDIILPQAIPLMLPPLGGVLVNLVKHSAIVSVSRCCVSSSSRDHFKIGG